jgi:hypothetical protein
VGEREAAAREEESAVARRDGDGDAGRYERPPAAGGHGRVLAGVQVEAGVTRVGVGRQREVAVESYDRHGHGLAHRWTMLAPPPRSEPGACRCQARM